MDAAFGSVSSAELQHECKLVGSRATFFSCFSGEDVGFNLGRRMQIKEQSFIFSSFLHTEAISHFRSKWRLKIFLQYHVYVARSMVTYMVLEYCQALKTRKPPSLAIFYQLP